MDEDDIYIYIYTRKEEREKERKDRIGPMSSRNSTRKGLCLWWRPCFLRAARVFQPAPRLSCIKSAIECLVHREFHGHKRPACAVSHNLRVVAKRGKKKNEEQWWLRSKGEKTIVREYKRERERERWMEEGRQIDRRERNDGQWNLFITFSGLEISSMIFVYCIFILCRFLYNPFGINLSIALTILKIKKNQKNQKWSSSFIKIEKESTTNPPKETKYAKYGRTGEEKRMRESNKKKKKKERKRSEILANSRVVAGAARHAGGIQVRRWRSTITLSALCRGWFILYASRGTITEPRPNRALISTGVRPLPFSRCLRRDGAAAYGARERDTARVRVGDTRAHGHLENSSSPRQNIGGYPPLLLLLPTLFPLASPER